MARRGSGQHCSERPLEEQARQVEALLQDSLLSKVVALARGALTTLVSISAAAALRTFFPEGELPDPEHWPQTRVTPELRAKLEAAIAHGIVYCARHKGPGPIGSRFEHWRSLATDAHSLQSSSKVVVRFLLGELLADFLELACGNVLRRLAARAAL